MMNILFITLSRIVDVDSRGIYTDLMRELAKKGNNVYIVSPFERRYKEKTKILDNSRFDDWHKNIHVLKVKTGNIQKTNIIEKGISTLLLESQITKAIKKYFKHIKFDLITYSTPPITIVRPILFVKNRDGARTYLMLKDIFPQNAVDLGMLKKTGIKGIIYKIFRKKEKKLYSISDRIGCMSQANVDYILRHNPDISNDKVEIFPNCIEPIVLRLDDEEKKNIRLKYGIPLDKKVYVYGGNLGKPQDIRYIIECLKKEIKNEKVFFLIVGDGTEFEKLEQFAIKNNPSNFKLMNKLPAEEYDYMIASCDVGMIFLDHRFTIPNFPSRLLSYLQAGIPVLVCSDTNTDIGKIVVDEGVGWWCESVNANDFSYMLNRSLNHKIDSYNIFRLLEKYSVKNNIHLLED